MKSKVWATEFSSFI